MLGLEEEPLIVVPNDQLTKPGNFELKILPANEVNENANIIFYSVLMQTIRYSLKETQEILQVPAGGFGSWKFPFLSVKPHMLLEKPVDFEIVFVKGDALDDQLFN